MFEEFITTKDLTVVKSISICKGVNTRTRIAIRKQKSIESVLDFYVVCQCVLQSFVRMEIDDDRKYIVTNLYKVKKGGKATDSDHLTSTLTVNFNTFPQKPNKVEIYNFRDKKVQEAFKESKSNTADFSKCFMNSNHENLQATDWMKVLMTHVNNAFPKIRIRCKNIKKHQLQANLSMSGTIL